MKMKNKSNEANVVKKIFVRETTRDSLLESNKCDKNFIFLHVNYIWFAFCAGCSLVLWVKQ